MDNTMALFSLIIAVIFFIGGFQIYGGNTKFLGDVEKNIRPEDKQPFCRQMSIVMFLMGFIELLDAILQYTMGESGWTLLILGGGLIVAIIWMYAIYRRYSKR